MSNNIQNSDYGPWDRLRYLAEIVLKECNRRKGNSNICEQVSREMVMQCEMLNRKKNNEPNGNHNMKGE